MESCALTFITLVCSLIPHASADLNADGRVDPRDLAVLAREWLAEVPHTGKGHQYYAAAPAMLPVFVDCCDDSNEWSTENVVLSDVSRWEDERAYLCGDKAFRSILVQKTPDTTWGYLLKEYAMPVDLSGCIIDVRTKIPTGSDSTSYQHILSLHMRLIDSTGQYAQYGIPASSPGWQRQQWTRTDFTETSGDVDWTRITACLIGLLTRGIGQQPAVILDRIALFRKPPWQGSLFDKPIVMNTFDDGDTSHYDAAAYLSGKGLCGTFYVIGAAAEGGVGLTLAELADMHWAGHLIANHTWSHPIPFGALTPAEQIREVTKMQAFMCEHGFADGARILTLPGNEWTVPVRDRLLPYVDHVRGNAGPYAYQRNPITAVALVSPTAALDNIRTQIVYALDPEEPPSIVVLMEHVLADRMDDFKAYVDYLADKRDAGLLTVNTPVDLLTRREQGSWPDG